MGASISMQSTGREKWASKRRENMAVFDGCVKTARRVADPITDKRVSSVASLTLPAINTPAALSYPGTDVSVIHGDQQLHVDRNRIMKVGMNQDVTIGMNEIYLVDMNRR
jgi:hypothetical protein